MSGSLSQYDFAMIAIPVVLLGSALAALWSALSMPVALAGGSLAGTGVLYQILVRSPPSG